MCLQRVQVTGDVLGSGYPDVRALFDMFAAELMEEVDDWMCDIVEIFKGFQIPPREVCPWKSPEREGNLIIVYILFIRL